MSEKIVIVGDGIAAITAIKSIRKADQESEIHLFGKEKFYPYNRVRLSKGLLSSLEEEKILLQKTKWYEENNINLSTDTEIVNVDTHNKHVILENGKKILYTKLLLANGAKNFTPPINGINKKGVYTLRELEDAWDIMDEMKKATSVLNIGGGIQGLETAWILSKLGKKVTIAEILPRLMPKQLDERASKMLERAVRSQGIDIMLNTEVQEILGDKEASGFLTKENNEYPCNMVTYSIGIKPNIDILANSNIHTNKGVVVNDKMETNINDVYAVGDVAEYQGEIYGLWNIAIGHGKVAGSNIVGSESIYEHIVPVTTLNAFNLSLFSMGVVDEDKATDVVVEEDVQENIYNKVFINNSKVIGAIVIGNIKYSPILKAAIEKNIDLSGIDFKDVSFSKLTEIIKVKI